MATRILLMLAILSGAGSFANSDDRAVLPERKKYLLLDSRVVHEGQNARLAIGAVEKHPANPLFDEKLPWETGMSHMYPNVVYDERESCYQIWYYTHMREWASDVAFGPGHAESEFTGGGTSTLYAVSEDGINWRKPELDAYLYRGKPTNIVAHNAHGTGVFKDFRDPDPQRRYKMIGSKHPGDKIWAAFSPDGIHWGRRHFAANARGDTHNNAFWAPTLNKYVSITRAYPVPAGDHVNSGRGIRTVLRMESENFLDWTEPVEVLRGPKESQIYSMPVFYHEGVYLGLPAIYRIGTDHRVHTELAWSPDTIHWHRIDQGAQLIPLSEKAGAFDWGCIYAAATPVVLDEEIRIYYSGEPGRHGWNPGYLGLAILRSDGWAGYVQDDPSKPGVVITQPLVCRGKTLRVTADLQPGGSVKATIMDSSGRKLIDGRTITASVTDGIAAELDGLEGKPLQIRLEIDKAQVYALAFGQSLDASPGGRFQRNE